jgi:hypothetical protein
MLHTATEDDAARLKMLIAIGHEKADRCPNVASRAVMGGIVWGNLQDVH